MVISGSSFYQVMFSRWQIVGGSSGRRPTYFLLFATFFFRAAGTLRQAHVQFSFAIV